MGAIAVVTKTFPRMELLLVFRERVISDKGSAGYVEIQIIKVLMGLSINSGSKMLKCCLTLIHFLIFFPLVVALYFSMPHKYRWVLLLSGKLLFLYGLAGGVYIFLIVFSTLIDYYAAIFMEKQKNQNRKRKSFLLLSLFL